MAGEGNKSANFWAPTLQGPHPSGPHHLRGELKGAPRAPPPGGGTQGSEDLSFSAREREGGVEEGGRGCHRMGRGGRGRWGGYDVLFVLFGHFWKIQK